jgi:TetR/AcrR family transcriptional repressor of nem operon
MAKPGITKDKLLQVAFDLIWNSSYGSVSVGDICDRAGVNKGSFYHFFESKTDLAVEAYQEHWKEKQPILDRLFSPQTPPLERLQQWCKFLYDSQKEKAEKYGHVCGCPYISLGAEVATQDEKIRAKSDELNRRGRKYLECTIADAIRADVVTVKDPILAAQRVWSTALGMLVQAKVQNSLEPLHDLEPTIMTLIGVKPVLA